MESFSTTLRLVKGIALCGEKRLGRAFVTLVLFAGLLGPLATRAMIHPLQTDLYFIYRHSDGVSFQVAAYDTITGEWQQAFTTEPYTQATDWWVHASGIYFSDPQSIQRVSLNGGQPDIIALASDGLGGAAIPGFDGFAFLGDVLYIGTGAGSLEERTYAVNRFSKAVLYSVEGAVSGTDLHLAPDNSFLYGDPSMSLRIPLSNGAPQSLVYDPLPNGFFESQNPFVEFNLDRGFVIYSSGSILTYPDFEYAGSIGGQAEAGAFHGDNFVCLTYPEQQGPDEVQPQIRAYDMAGKLLGAKEIQTSIGLFEMFIQDDTLLLFHREHFQSDWPPYTVQEVDLSEIYSNTGPTKTFLCDPLDIKGTIQDYATFSNGDYLFRAYGDTYQGEKHSLFRYSHSNRTISKVYSVTRYGNLVTTDGADAVYIGESDGTIWKIPSGEDYPVYFTSTPTGLQDMAFLHGDILVVNSGDYVLTYNIDGQLLNQRRLMLWTGFAEVNPSTGQILTAHADHGRILVNEAGQISTVPTARSQLGVIDPSQRYTTFIETGGLKIYDIDTNVVLASNAFAEYRNLKVLDWNAEGIFLFANDPSDPWHPDPDAYVLLLDPATLDVIWKRTLSPEYKDYFLFRGKAYPMGGDYVGWVKNSGPGYGQRIIPITLEEMLGGPVTSMDAFGGWVRSAQWTWGPEFGHVRRDQAPWYYQGDFGWLWLGPWGEDGAWFFKKDPNEWIFIQHQYFPMYFSPGRNGWCHKVLVEEYNQWLFDLTMGYWVCPAAGPAPHFMDGRWMVVDPGEIYGPSQLVWFHDLWFSFDTAVPELYDYLPMGFPYTYTRLDSVTGFVDWMDGGMIENVTIKGWFKINFISEKEGTLDSHIEVSDSLPNSPFYEEDVTIPFIIVPAGSWSR